MNSRTMIFSLIFLASASRLFGQSNPVFIQFQPGTVKGALYKPDKGPAPHVGILYMHETGNYMSGAVDTELAKRGFMVLGMNGRYENNESSIVFENDALDVKTGIEFLKRQPGIRKVVLIGHSGGGVLMSFYQAVAEKGLPFCQAPKRLMQCSNDLAGLPSADGIVLMDAHGGHTVNLLREISPLVDDSDPASIPPELDLFSPNNGYNPTGPSHYSEEFKQRYFKAQAARMNRLIDLAEWRWQQVKSGKGLYPDDEPFVVLGGRAARLLEVDPSIAHSTVKPQKLLKNDGTVITQIVESVRVPIRRSNQDMIKRHGTFWGGAHIFTLRSFLSDDAIRATDSMDGIAWCSSNNSTTCAVQNISIPTLIAGMGGYYFVRDSEIYYDNAASKDKDFIVVEGAGHDVEECTECEKSSGQYSNTIKNYFDYVQKWINARF